MHRMILSLCVPWALFGPRLAEAATLSVGASGQYDSIQDAIDAASDGDTIEVEAGVWEESLTTYGKSLTIAGVSGADDTILEASGSDAALAASSGALTLTGFTVVNEDGRAILASQTDVSISDCTIERSGAEKTNGGAIAIEGGSLSLDGVRIDDCEAALGGAIYASDDATIAISDASFAGNAAENGGAIYLDGAGAMSIDLSTFEDNYAQVDGGGIYATGTQSVIDVTDSTFDDNSANEGDGGAFFVTLESDLTASNVLFSDNYAYYYGGAIYGEETIDITVSDSEFLENSCRYAGGGIGAYYGYGNLDISNTTFTGNEATYSYGGAVYAYYYVAMTLIDSVVEDNISYNNGGGVYHYYGDLLITGTVFEDNFNEYGPGGGLYTYYPGASTAVPMTISGNSFLRNSADDEGGGLHLRSASWGGEVTDNTFEGNESLYGGGLYVYSGSSVEFRRNWIAGNTAEYGGGVYEWLASTSEWTNNVVQDNISQFAGGLCFVDSESGVFRNNTVVGNIGLEDVSSVCLIDAFYEFTNNVFASGLSGTALVAYDLNSSFYSTFQYNDFWDNVDGDFSGKVTKKHISEATDNLFVDPGFATWANDGDPSNDSVVLARSSVLIDAGDPFIADPDGSVSDVGAYGGPDALALDADGDGYDTTQDCDDGDASVYPGATETWYDGTNGDCEPGSDNDADGDGADAYEMGGTDCDDADPAVIEGDCGQSDAQDTGFDFDDLPGDFDIEDVEDTVSTEPGTASEEKGCGCSSTARQAPGLWLWVPLAFVGLRRRD